MNFQNVVEDQFENNLLSIDKQQKLNQLTDNYPGVFQLVHQFPDGISSLESFTRGLQKQEIGIGSYAEIYKTMNFQTGKQCAIKIQTINQDNLLEAAQEFITQLSLQKINKQYFLNLQVPILLDIYKSKMMAELDLAEYSLDDQIRNHEINYNEYEQISIQLIKGLCILHQNNYAHRDIRPKNILYVNKQWVYSDFGLTIKYNNQFDQYKLEGTTAYLQKEIVDKLKQGMICQQINLFQCDKYALQLTLAQILKQNQELQDIKMAIDNNTINDKYIQLLNENNLNLLAYHIGVNPDPVIPDIK